MIEAMSERWGAMQAIKLTGVGNMGGDIDDVKLASGTMQYRAATGSDGKSGGLLVTDTP